MSPEVLLEISNLSVSYGTLRGQVSALSNFSMSIPAGSVVGLVGESGCGKTTLAKTIMQLLPPNGFLNQGEIFFKGKDLTLLSDSEIRAIRWKEIAMVPQSAMNSLNPVYRVGDQLVETMVVREGVNRKTAWKRAGQLFEMVGIKDSRLRDFPHQFSGGMKQRATIALAMSLSPRLIIADEPTTALDVLVQARILDLLRDLKKKLGLTLIYITHDLSVASQTCDFLGVMYAGELVEFGPTKQVLSGPFHPYTMGLVSAVPRRSMLEWEPVSIPGAPPDLLQEPEGCRFVERCPFAANRCAKESTHLLSCAEFHQAACHYIDRAGTMRKESQAAEIWETSLAGRSKSI
jgi:oligopeptide/dipeptide ABC transporter ATP-binding protein